MSASTPRADPAQLPILDAACVLLVDRQGTRPRLLMGLRRPDNVFLPNKWVFPGGRLEATDFAVEPATPLGEDDAAALLAALPAPVSPLLPQALAVAAVRELFEETGHALALKSGEAGAPRGTACPRLGPLGLVPTLAPLRLIARAITPPGRTRRYDTRFFVTGRASVIEAVGPADGEFTEQGWFTFPEAEDLDLPNITRRILADLKIALARGFSDPPAAVPFYYQEGEAFRRDLIPRGLARSQP